MSPAASANFQRQLSERRVRVHSGFRVHNVCIENADLAFWLPTEGYDSGKRQPLDLSLHDRHALEFWVVSSKSAKVIYRHRR